MANTNPQSDWAPLHDVNDMMTTSFVGTGSDPTSGLTHEMKTYYDRVLLERTVPNLHHLKFGSPKRVPRHGGRVMEWRKFEPLGLATTELVEGKLFDDLQEVHVSAITGGVKQYGSAVGFSDIVSTTTIDALLTETTMMLAEQAARTIDVVVRDTLHEEATFFLFANARASRATIVATDNFLEMNGDGGVQAGGSLSDLRLIALQMEINRARRIGGYWQAITDPRVMFDIQGTTEWREAQLYNQTNRVFDGSVGEMYGIKFWVTDVAKEHAIGEPAGGDQAAVPLHTMLVFGENAFGVVKLAGHNLQTIFKPLGSAGTADALNQQSTMGWKTLFGTKLLHPQYMLVYECSVSTNIASPYPDADV